MKVRVINPEFGITGAGAHPVGTVLELDDGYCIQVLIPLRVVEPVTEPGANKSAPPAARRSKATTSAKETR